MVTTTLTRRLLAGAGLTAALGITVLAPAPAQAGGPGQVYVYGSTASECNNNLGRSIQDDEQAGATISGVHRCRLTGSGSQYFGDYIANYD